MMQFWTDKARREMSSHASENMTQLHKHTLSSTFSSAEFFASPNNFWQNSLVFIKWHLNQMTSVSENSVLRCYRKSMKISSTVLWELVSRWYNNTVEIFQFTAQMTYGFKKCTDSVTEEIRVISAWKYIVNIN